MPADILGSLRYSLLLLLKFVVLYCSIVQCTANARNGKEFQNPLPNATEGSGEEPVTTTTKSPEQLQAEYDEKCKHRGPFCFEQTYVNIAITILGALVFLISACIAGCVSRRQGNV